MGSFSWRAGESVRRGPWVQRALIAGGCALGLLLMGLLAVPSVVRAKVERAASERGLVAEVDAVRAGLGRIWLKGVRITSPGDDLELRLDAVSIGLSGAVDAQGGTLRGSGSPSELARRLKQRGTAHDGAGSGSGRRLSLRGLFVHWSIDGAAFDGFGFRAERDGSRSEIGADLARLSAAKLSLEARGLAAALATQGETRVLQRLRTRALELTWLDPTRPSTPAAVPSGGSRAPPSEAAEVVASPAARLRALRAVALPLVRSALAEGADVRLEGVGARVQRGAETLSFGPSTLQLLRDAEAVRVSLVPSANEAGVTPLSLRLAVPLSSGGMHVVASGGPVTLSSLGARAGQLGLRDVRRATLAADGSAEFSDDFESVNLDGKLALRELLLQRQELSAEVVGPFSFEGSLTAHARLDGSELVIDQSNARFGDVRAELSGKVATGDGTRSIDGRLRVPLSGCQSVLDAVPHGLLPLVQGVHLSGAFGIDLQVRYDRATPQQTRVALSVQNDCRILDAPPALSAHKFERPFLREVKAPDGSAMTIESGPGTPSWISIDDMSKHLETAILVCEDAGFYSHAGFDFRALENAIKDDLKQGRFARGASTVSMQLAKNLYLGKEKTLGRKLQEAVLTMLLEQQLDKRRILELYLNVVELGPGLYGVGDAAQYYFATPARALTLGQALYLATLLPSPTFSHFAPDGKLSAGWLSYLHRLMQIAHKIKRVDDTELSAGLEEEIEFRRPGSAPPSPPEGELEPPQEPAVP